MEITTSQFEMFVENRFSAAQFKRDLKSKGFNVKVVKGGKFDRYDDGYQVWDIKPTKKCTTPLADELNKLKFMYGAYHIIE